MGEGWQSFTAAYKETDLWIGVDRASFQAGLPRRVENWIKELRAELEAYLARDQKFLSALQPHALLPDAPALAREMAGAAGLAGVGPMAAVAGAFAQAIGRRLLEAAGVRDVLVENGGDLFLQAARNLEIGIYAGASPLSNKVGLSIAAEEMPLGICTSAGKVGHSLSFGQADAVVVKSNSAALADAYATALGNRVQSPVDIQDTLAWGSKLPGLAGVLIICGEHLGAWGQIQIIKL